jgi:uncharacterized protein YkwD
VTAHSPLLRRAVIVLAIGAVAFGSAACQPKRAASAPAPAPAPTAAQAPAASEAGQFLSLVNAFRAANGVGPVSIAGDATAKAQQHAADMAAQGRLFHSGSLASGVQPGWTALGENVGMGGSVPQLESMFEASGPHSTNLLNGAYNQIGFGVARGADGSLFVTQFFVGR